MVQHSLGSLSPKKFLSHYWQKKPLLLRNALKPLPHLISPDELAGLSCDSAAHSRLIIEKGGKTPWEVKKGPFDEKTFAKLPKTHWTLLVNSVERFIPEVHALLNYFTFLPNWRLDDIMISYAVKKGNVGAHVDNFDVFLVQISGEREWSIEEKPRYDDEYQPGLKVRLLKKFKPTQKWVLKPGDILYLPPRVPHHGISQSDDCMTLSVGFRAPTERELLEGAFSYFMSNLPEGLRYSDPDLMPQEPGEISDSAIKKIQEALSFANHPKLLSRWFGCWTTANDTQKSKLKKKVTLASLDKYLSKSSALFRNEGTRIAWRKVDSILLLFVDGCEYELSVKEMKFVKCITNGVSVNSAQIKKSLTKKAKETLISLINDGTFYPDSKS